MNLVYDQLFEMSKCQLYGCQWRDTNWFY